MASLPPEQQAKIREGTAQLLAEMPLHKLRRAQEMSQQTLAEILGQSQSAILQMERQTDMQVSTLRRYIEAMGGELEIVAHFPEGDVRITQFAAA